MAANPGLPWTAVLKLRRYRQRRWLSQATAGRGATGAATPALRRPHKKRARSTRTNAWLDHTIKKGQRNERGNEREGGGNTQPNTGNGSGGRQSLHARFAHAIRDE